MIAATAATLAATTTLARDDTHITIFTTALTPVLRVVQITRASTLNLTIRIRCTLLLFALSATRLLQPPAPPPVIVPIILFVAALHPVPASRPPFLLL
jgi:hypothetical protein